MSSLPLVHAPAAPAQSGQDPLWMDVMVRWGWVPIPCLALLLGAALVFSGQAPHEYPRLLAFLFLFLSLPGCVLAAWIFTRCFLRERRPFTLLAANGTLLWGMASLAPVLFPPGDPNTLVTFHNLSLWCASLFLAAGAVLDSELPAGVRRPWLWATLGHGIALAFSAAILGAVRNQVTTTFFIQGQGGTMVRQLVLGNTVLNLAFAALLARGRSRQSRAMAICLHGLWILALGVLGILLQRSTANLVGWTGRVAQLLAVPYLVAASWAWLASTTVQASGRPAAVPFADKLPFAFAAEMVLVAMTLRYAILEALNGRAEFITFYPAVALAAAYGGFVPALLALPLAVVASSVWVEGPIDSFPEILAMALFVVSCILIAAFGSAMREARARSARLEERAEAALDLEVREKALQAAVLDLTRSNRDLEHFAYVASHDLQEPLRMIRNFMGLLDQRVERMGDPQSRRYMAFALEAAERMQMLIHGLLAYARIQPPGADARKRFRLDECLTDVLADLQGAMAEAGAELAREPLPEAWGDPLQVRQVLQNLLTNALRFRGAEAPRIRVGGRSDVGFTEVWVVDNGIGMDQADAPRIFELFGRLHGREAYPGNGIGLAICKKIVQAHGGEIRVESEPGRGATFRFTLSLPGAP